ncbi:cysteine-rich receptor-like protein kinase 42 [Aristolochia californica]|uniref:cysteine-rich receptor-like protein kinase 42 n=1 Tax=Aristolochia californica TaxID=171875 RepID=UPI0035D9A01A
MEIKFRDPVVFFTSCFASSSVFFLLIAGGVSSDPQINLLDRVCTLYNVTNPDNFSSDLNATFSDLRRAVLSSSHFATAERARASDPIYALFQCREYLSVTDCLSCFSAAATQIRNCSTAHGARIVYDGCFLRYENYRFFDQTTLAGDVELCGNEMAPETGRFNASARGLLEDLVAETPKINGYFAAARRDGAYGVAQCAETVNQSGCGYCLKVAYGNIQVCLPATQGRAFDAGCFLRYSKTSFFGDYQTIDLAAFNCRGNKKNGIIGALVGGVSFFLLAFSYLFLYVSLSRTREVRTLGATEQDGIVNFRHKDLKSATKNFSEENKLGGFGNVYLGLLKNGKRVAVQKLAITQDHRVKACIEKELDLVSRIWHRNLVRLLGWCSKGPELLIVYEFVGNKSLEKILFGDGSGTLNWKQRFDVIVGIAQGLRYT